MCKYPPGILEHTGTYSSLHHEQCRTATSSTTILRLSFALSPASSRPILISPSYLQPRPSLTQTSMSHLSLPVYSFLRPHPSLLSRFMIKSLRADSLASAPATFSKSLSYAAAVQVTSPDPQASSVAVYSPLALVAIRSPAQVRGKCTEQSMQCRARRGRF